MNIVNISPSLTAPFPLLFLFNLPNTDPLALVTNLGRTSLSKGTARPNDTSLPKLPIILPTILPRSTLLNYFRKMSFTKFYVDRHIFSEGISYFSLLSCY